MAVLSRQGEVAILSLGKNIKGQWDFAACHREVMRLLQEERISKFVIDMASVTRVTSAQLGMLVAIHRSLRDQGGGLKLANLSDHLHHTLTRTRLHLLLEHCDSVEQAITGFETAQS